MTSPKKPRLDRAALLELGRWNTPTIYNGWEQITSQDAGRNGFNLEDCRDFMPEMGPMVGYAVTVKIEPGNAVHKETGATAWSDYRRYVASLPGPTIVVVEDMDKPATYGAFWGEVNSTIHRTLGCVGTITDGAIRDVDEMRSAGFKAIARRLCVGHAYSVPVAWDIEVEVFGRKVVPGRLIHADKHGFLVIPEEDEAELLEAARFMDTQECRTMIPAAQSAAGRAPEDRLAVIDEACATFARTTRARFARPAEF